MSVWKSDEKLVIFASLISPSKSFCLKSNIKYSTQCFINRSITSKFVRSTPLRVVFSTVLSVFHLLVKHCVFMLDILLIALTTLSLEVSLVVKLR